MGTGHPRCIKRDSLAGKKRGLALFRERVKRCALLSGKPQKADIPLGRERRMSLAGRRRGEVRGETGNNSSSFETKERPGRVLFFTRSLGKGRFTIPRGKS